MDEQLLNQTETLSKNLDEEIMDISKAPEPVEKKVVINATIPKFSVNNLSRKAQDIFKESLDMFQYGWPIITPPLRRGGPLPPCF